MTSAAPSPAKAAVIPEGERRHATIMLSDLSGYTAMNEALDPETVQEIMGRNAGWLAAATGLARRSDEDAPHLIYVPEIPVSWNKVAGDVREVLRRLGRCVLAVSEGCVDEQGKYLSEQAGSFGKDAFGHAQLGGAAETIGAFIEKEVGVKARRNKPGTLQRNGAHWASRTDVEEAWRCGQAAVYHALAGTSGQMVTLVRESNRPYRCATGLARLSEVANGESKLPRDFMDAAGTGISKKFRAYLTPLVQGEIKPPMGPDGLPLYVRLRRKLLAKKCGAWQK